MSLCCVLCFRCSTLCAVCCLLYVACFDRRDETKKTVETRRDEPNRNNIKKNILFPLMICRRWNTLRYPGFIPQFRDTFYTYNSIFVIICIFCTAHTIIRMNVDSIVYFVSFINTYSVLISFSELSVCSLIYSFFSHKPLYVCKI